MSGKSSLKERGISFEPDSFATDFTSLFGAAFLIPVDGDEPRPDYSQGIKADVLRELLISITPKRRANKIIKGILEIVVSDNLVKRGTVASDVLFLPEFWKIVDEKDNIAAFQQAIAGDFVANRILKDLHLQILRRISRDHNLANYS